MSDRKFEKFEGEAITDEMFKAAGKLFSNNYGVWGPLAESKMGDAMKRGSRVKMSAKVVKKYCVSSKGHTVYVRVLVDGILVGNLFATRWEYEGQNMVWITQLCVSSEYRNRGYAKGLLENLGQSDNDRAFGSLSSHPFAILAVLRVYGRGVEDVNFDMTKAHARSIMQSCPVAYVTQAKLHGSLFDSLVDDKSVSCADTGFWVDHEEPLAALISVREKGIDWPLGDLPEGHEFLIIVNTKTSEDHR